MAARRTIVWTVLIAMHAGAAIAAAQGVDPALDRCAGDTRDRLRFIEEHLDSKQTYAQRWSIGWNSVYTVGIVFEGARAGFADDRGDRADHIVSAVKSSVGLAEGLLRPPPQRLGTRELRDLPTSTPDECAARLARAEEILRENAADSKEQRFGWKAHAGNLALNLAGALVLAEGFGDESAAWQSGALGFVVGEGRIWSYPWHAPGALAEYERRFPASGLPPTPETTWRLESWGGGARLVVSY
jgi:hypothetical protein